MSDVSVAACPVCGAYSDDVVLASTSALLAVCDVLVVNVLTATGRRLSRRGRARFREMDGRPWHVAHTIWKPDDEAIEHALKLDTWAVVPALLDNHGCCGVTSRQVVAMLDSYVRDLLVTGTAHNLDDLRYRMETRLGIALPAPRAAYPGQVAHTAET